jgi:hypothetical protein
MTGAERGGKTSNGGKNVRTKTAHANARIWPWLAGLFVPIRSIEDHAGYEKRRRGVLSLSTTVFIGLYARANTTHPQAKGGGLYVSTTVFRGLYPCA